jgi:glycosyltransferase involved in cell wall biosynthesis
MSPIVSIVIPSYNHAQYIEAAIRSVLQQTLQDIELIVIDDGSKDDSPTLLAAINDPRMQVLFQENRGAHATINRGLKIARGKYLAILNSDDEYMPTRLEVAVAELERNPDSGFVSTWIELIDDEGRSLGVKRGWENMLPWPIPQPSGALKALNEFNLNLLASNFISTTSNIVMRSELFDEVGEFRNLRFVHDWDFCLRAVSTQNAMLIPKPLMKYRVHGTNTIRQDQTGMIFEVCWVLAANLPALRNRLVRSASVEQARDFGMWLTNSLWTFGNDRIFMMLSLLATVDEGKGHDGLMKLLEIDNPVRLTYLKKIRERSAETQPSKIENTWAKLLKLVRLLFARKAG